MTKEMAKSIIEFAKGNGAKIVKALTDRGFNVDDKTNESGYLNLYVHNDDGTAIRIYKAYDGRISVQRWTPCKMKYSGIPTFEPSGKKSF